MWKHCSGLLYLVIHIFWYQVQIKGDEKVQISVWRKNGEYTSVLYFLQQMVSSYLVRILPVVQITKELACSKWDDSLHPFLIIHAFFIVWDLLSFMFYITFLSTWGWCFLPVVICCPQDIFQKFVFRWNFLSQQKVEVDHKEMWKAEKMKST